MEKSQSVAQIKPQCLTTTSLPLKNVKTIRKLKVNLNQDALEKEILLEYNKNLTANV